ncbi:hypothetical protein GCK72_003680 [Caenorhabditis remanei]|uniref:RING-type domain-containing protein n=1 Tax=Caenorhabditis remanei TaxID=31234 RepID=A0A6A5H982_CAERE|nr:hypothetical protein GCK72_003680 [Caenorhabditis remanei]KAF1763735.1 hypothetical protein GCK72_003680 [Caenorhabditis remanei]
MAIEYLCNSQTGRTVPPELFFNSNEMSTKEFKIKWRDNSRRRICLITTLPTWLTMESPKSFTRSPYRFQIGYDPSHADGSTSVQLVFELNSSHYHKMTVSITLNFWQGRPIGAECCNCAILEVAGNRLPKFQTFCGHTLCKKCLREKLKSTRIIEINEKFKKFSECPECQRNIYEYPVEYPCSTCTRNESDRFCMECNGYYCNNCSEKFHTGQYSRHRFTKMTRLDQHLETLREMASRLRNSGAFLKTKYDEMEVILSSFNMENETYRYMEETVITKCRGLKQLRSRKLIGLNKFLEDKMKECKNASLSLNEDYVKIDDLRKWIDRIRKKEKNLRIHMEEITNRYEKALCLECRWKVTFHSLNDYHIPKDAPGFLPMLKRKGPHG